MFSIILPTYNNLEYLKLCLASIKKNSNFDHEIIIHINEGTDGTLDYLKEVNDFGISRIICTDINKDGMKTSPNFDEILKIAEVSKSPIVISGGVSSIDDIKKTKAFKNKKIEGIIVGKAIYDGDIKLDELAKELNA